MGLSHVPIFSFWLKIEQSEKIRLMRRAFVHRIKVTSKRDVTFRKSPLVKGVECRCDKCRDLGGLDLSKR